MFEKRHKHNEYNSESSFYQNHISKFCTPWFIIPFKFIIGYNTKLSYAWTTRPNSLYLFFSTRYRITLYIFFYSDLFIREVKLGLFMIYTKLLYYNIIIYRYRYRLPLLYSVEIFWNDHSVDEYLASCVFSIEWISIDLYVKSILYKPNIT